MIRILYDGSPASVNKIMDAIGTKGVLNTPHDICYLPCGGRIHKGDHLVVEDGFWWVELTDGTKTLKNQLEKEPNQ